MQHQPSSTISKRRRVDHGYIVCIHLKPFVELSRGMGCHCTMIKFFPSTDKSTPMQSLLHKVDCPQTSSITNGLYFDVLMDIGDGSNDNNNNNTYRLSYAGTPCKKKKKTMRENMHSDTFVFDSASSSLLKLPKLLEDTFYPYQFYIGTLDKPIIECFFPARPPQIDNVCGNIMSLGYEDCQRLRQMLEACDGREEKGHPAIQCVDTIFGRKYLVHSIAGTIEMKKRAHNVDLCFKGVKNVDILDKCITRILGLPLEALGTKVMHMGVLSACIGKRIFVKQDCLLETALTTIFGASVIRLHCR